MRININPEIDNVPALERHLRETYQVFPITTVETKKYKKLSIQFKDKYSLSVSLYPRWIDLSCHTTAKRFWLFELLGLLTLFPGMGGDVMLSIESDKFQREVTHTIETFLKKGRSNAQ